MWRTHLVWAVVAAGCWSTPRPEAPSRELHLGIQVVELRLDNGLRVVMVPDPHSADVSVTMFYGVGGVDDPPGLDGIAHLVEHVMFEPVRDGETLFDHLTATALQFDGRTTGDATIYTERGRPDQRDDLLAVEALRLASRCTTVSDVAFARQREIIRNELRERAATDRVHAAIDGAVFAPDQPYHRPLGGTAASVEAITRDQACAFADAHYGPANAVLVIGGQIGTDARAAIEHAFAQIRNDVAPPRASAVSTTAHARTTVSAPVDTAAVVFAWPMPTDAIAAARVRAVAAMAGARVNAKVDAEVSLVELGGTRASAIAIMVKPRRSIEDAIAGLGRGMRDLSQWLGTGLFEQARGMFVDARVAALEPGLERDSILAEYAFAHRDVAASVESELRALVTLSRDDASSIVDSGLALSSATVVVVEPDGTTDGVGELGAVVDEPPRPRSENPAEAHVAASAIVPGVLARVQTRTLANGMHVVLLPTSGVPSVEVRLIVDVGMADDPARQTGVAKLAATAIYAHPSNDSDMLSFRMAGGFVDADVGRDHTRFAAHGVATHLDLMIAAIAHTVIDGVYGSLRQAVETASHASNQDFALVLAWRTALYGEHHPYTGAGLWERAKVGVGDVDVVRAFELTHYRPDAATLVITGGFDPALAARWIDYAFSTWTGNTTTARQAPEASLRPFSFIRATRSSQIDVRIALPVRRMTRAAALIATEMIDQSAAAIREELAASYGLNATLVEERLATMITIQGNIDASRAPAAVERLRDRLAKLGDTGEDAAKLFVSARRRVIARLVSMPATARALADVAEGDLDVHRAVGSELEIAEQVRTMTIERLAPALRDVELQRAAMLIIGPRPAAEAAYVAIGRTAVEIR